MDFEQVKYIIPPKLKTRITFFGYYPEELLIITPLLFAGFIQKVYHSNDLLLAAAAFLAALFFRGAGEKNSYNYLKLLYRFYFKPQIFTLRECDKNNANK